MRTTLPQAANQPLGTVGDPPTIKKNAEKRKLRLRLSISVLIFSSLFFGWPQIFDVQIGDRRISFPPEIQVAEAAATLENVATAAGPGNSENFTLNFGWTATAGRLLVLSASWDKTVTGLSESRVLVGDIS